MPRNNLNSLFADFARNSRDTAVVQRRGYRRETWTYAELGSFAYSAAHDLRTRGIGLGDRVILFGPNSAEWMAAFWSSLLLGAVAVPLDDASTPDFLVRVARETSARVIFATRDKIRQFPASAKPLEPSGAAVPWLALEDLTERDPAYPRPPQPETYAAEPITRNHIAQILFTSGTTAEPRGVVLTHGNFLANLEPLERGIDPYRKYERWFHPLRFVTLVPLSHVFGQFMALFVPPLLAATVVFENSANPSEIIRTINRERATALVAVPRMLDSLYSGILRDVESRREKQRFDRTFTAADGQKFLQRAWMFRRIHRRFGWKFWAFICGGAALSRDTEDFFKRIGYAVVQGYGMTETASLISLNHPFRAAQGSIGKVLPGRECKLADDGEILVRGENVASGYWQAGALRPTEERGWLRTGDIGELDSEGNLRFRSRKKNVIVTPAGLNVYAEDLEAALRRQPQIRDAVVVPIDRGGNAEPCAVLLPSGTGIPTGVPDAHAINPPPGSLSLRTAVDAANRSLAEYQQIRTWLIWPDPDFPRTSTGKPRLAEITAGALQIVSGKNAIATPGNLQDLIARFAASDNPSDHLEQNLNLSSLDRVELMSALEQRYQVELNETAFAEAKTVGDVQRLLQAQSAHGGASSLAPAAHHTDYLYPRWTQREPARWLRLTGYYALVWPATQILGHPKIVGRENLRGIRGPLLIVSNHITRRADIGLILAALPTRYRHHLATAMGGETLRRMRTPPQNWFFARRCAYQLGYWLVTALFNAFPLPQLSGFRESFRFAGESIDRGYSVLVFPEGETNESATGEMAKFQPGIGLLAQNLRVPVVPMRLDGVWQMKRERRRLAHFGEITVHLGQPITFAPGTPPEQIAEALHHQINSLDK